MRSRCYQANLMHVGTFLKFEFVANYTAFQRKAVATVMVHGHLQACVRANGGHFEQLS